MIQETVKRLGFELLEHPPYSLDLAPCDVLLFPLIKGALRGMRFEHVSDLTCALQQEISEIPNFFFQECFVSWTQHSRKCADYKSSYSERE